MGAKHLRRSTLLVWLVLSCFSGAALAEDTSCRCFSYTETGPYSGDYGFRLNFRNECGGQVRFYYWRKGDPDRHSVDIDAHGGSIGEVDCSGSRQGLCKDIIDTKTDCARGQGASNPSNPVARVPAAPPSTASTATQSTPAAAPSSSTTPQSTPGPGPSATRNVSPAQCLDQVPPCKAACKSNFTTGFTGLNACNGSCLVQYNACNATGQAAVSIEMAIASGNAAIQSSQSPATSGWLKQLSSAPPQLQQQRQISRDECSSNACDAGCANIAIALGAAQAATCKSSCAAQLSDCRATGRSQPAYAIAAKDVASKLPAAPYQAPPPPPPRPREVEATTQPREPQLRTDDGFPLATCVSRHDGSQILCCLTSNANFGGSANHLKRVKGVEVIVFESCNYESYSNALAGHDARYSPWSP
jgi:hypothetical protein